VLDVHLRVRQLFVAKAARPDVLRSLVVSLQQVTTAEARVTSAWRTRMCDVTGRSDSPVEPVFLQLLAALQRWLRDGEQLKPTHTIIGNSTQAAQARAVVDELANAAHRVAVLQLDAVRWLVVNGRLYVRKAELAKRDPEFNQRPSVWRLRYPQPYWVRTARASCFDELTSAVAEVSSSFAEAVRWRSERPEVGAADPGELAVLGPEPAEPLAVVPDPDVELTGGPGGPLHLLGGIDVP
jgi:hypothetical protein